MELGTEGRLIRMQLQELVGDVPAEKMSVIYRLPGARRRPDAQQVLLGLASLPYRRLLELDVLPTARLSRGRRLDHYGVSPRGYRILSHIPRVPEPIVDKVVSD